jgi:hypothetical protein
MGTLGSRIAKEVGDGKTGRGREARYEAEYGIKKARVG